MEEKKTEDIEIILSRKRMCMLIVHHDKIAEELQNLYPKQKKVLLDKYKVLEKIFNDILDEETKYQASLLQ